MNLDVFSDVTASLKARTKFPPAGTPDRTVLEFFRDCVVAKYGAGKEGKNLRLQATNDEVKALLNWARVLEAHWDKSLDNRNYRETRKQGKLPSQRNIERSLAVENLITKLVVVHQMRGIELPPDLEEELNATYPVVPRLNPVSS